MSDSQNSKASEPRRASSNTFFSGLLGLMATIGLLAMIYIAYVLWDSRSQAQTPVSATSSTEEVICDNSSQLDVLWAHRGFDRSDLEVVKAAVLSGTTTTVGYADSHFWGQYAAGKETGNAKAFIRDMFPGGQAEAVVVTVGEETYLVLLCNCGVKAVYRLTKPPVVIVKKVIVYKRQPPRPTPDGGLTMVCSPNCTN